ncbi:protein of unknown function [Agreia sp. COWG]|nr:protein of unknown function [Agreia sp. COWG]
MMLSPSFVPRMLARLTTASVDDVGSYFELAYLALFALGANKITMAA